MTTRRRWFWRWPTAMRGRPGCRAAVWVVVIEAIGLGLLLWWDVAPTIANVVAVASVAVIYYRALYRRGDTIRIGLDDFGLRVVRSLQPRRIVGWKAIRGVAAVGEEVHVLTDAEPIVLDAAMTRRWRLVELVREQTGLATPAEPEPLPAEEVCRWLGVAEGGALEGNRRLLRRRLRWPDVVVLLWSAALLAAGWAERSILALLAGLIFGLIGVSDWGGVSFRADASGIRVTRWWQGARTRQLSWAELRSVLVLDGDVLIRGGRTNLSLPAGTSNLDRLLAAVNQATAARAAGQLLPRSGGLTDAALSRAETATAEVDRGLTRTDS